MITKRYVFNKTVVQIAERLRNEGFEYQKNNERILRLHQEGFDVIIINIIDSWPIFQIETFLGIRINKVEEIINLFLKYSFASPKYMKYTETISTSYKILSRAEENHIEIESEEDLDNAINDLTKLCYHEGFEFFEKHRDIETLNILKKHQILYEHEGLSLHHDQRSLMQSLTLMKLCNDPDFEKLSIKYKELHVPFAGEEESGRKAINDLIEYLKKLK